MSKYKTVVMLHMLILIYSVSGIFSKLAANEVFLSPKFILYYSVVILLLGVYAIGWQQILKKLPLTVAYSNRAITIAWGMVWGWILFKEVITFEKLFGIIIIIIGVIMFVREEELEM